MQIPLLVLSVFVAWTMIILLSLFIARSRHLARGGSHADFGIQDSSLLIYRLSRAHANCLESLPLYIGLVVLLTLRDLSNIGIDILAALFMLFRFLQSVIHIANINPLFRFLCLLVQLVCLFGLLSYAVLG
ncbi:MAG: MAPEG family protein [Pseudomonadales bacterium]|nr:MAPEG family protein [Pseudomonadales bacterium]